MYHHCQPIYPPMFTTSATRAIAVYWEEYDEHRRIKLVGDEATSFASFQKCLERKFHRELPMDKYKIEYKDANYWFIVDTDEELAVSMGISNDGWQHYRIRLSKSQKSLHEQIEADIRRKLSLSEKACASCDDQNEQVIEMDVNLNSGKVTNILGNLQDEANENHYQITCDNCEAANFSGPRYKCSTCNDYDLCKQCYDNNVHMEHEFILIEKPLCNMTSRLRSLPCLLTNGLTPPFLNAIDRMIHSGVAAKIPQRQANVQAEQPPHQQEINEQEDITEVEPDCVLVNRAVINDEPTAPPCQPNQSSDNSLDDKVANALRQMESMGFRDESGWLTILLKERNGNVYEVLELMDAKSGCK